MTKQHQIILGITLASCLSGTQVYADTQIAQKEVAKKAAIIDGMHDKARKALVNAAQDNTYQTYLKAHATHDHAAGALKDKVDQVSLSVQDRFRVSEMCLIHKNGPELARIVGNKIASDLSPDESGAVFFAPAFSLPPRETFIAPVYMSPDADKLVVAYATPILVEDHNEAILHYEHSLALYQAALNKAVPANTIVLAVDESGRVVSDSRAEIPIAKQGEAEDVGAYLKPLNLKGLDWPAVKARIDQGQPVTDDQGNSYDGAYKHIEHWNLVVLNKH